MIFYHKILLKEAPPPPQICAGGGGVQRGAGGPKTGHHHTLQLVPNLEKQARMKLEAHLKGDISKLAILEGLFTK